jgi:transcriptional regulator, tetR family
MSETRIPTQKRSIEKRNKIIAYGFELMCNKGYYNVSTNDIAKYAEVSTGIIYQYFNDKKDIFIEGIKNYSDNIMFPILNVLKNNDVKINNLESLLNEMLDIFIKQHTLSKNAHEEMLALSHLDSDIAEIFHQKELDTTTVIVKTLKENNISSENLFEKVHIVIGIVENYCHEMVYHHHKTMNYDVMKKEVIKIITNILTN